MVHFTKKCVLISDFTVVKKNKNIYGKNYISLTLCGWVRELKNPKKGT